jgi:hypothetical protein
MNVKTTGSIIQQVNEGPSPLALYGVADNNVYVISAHVRLSPQKVVLYFDKNYCKQSFKKTGTANALDGSEDNFCRCECDNDCCG